MVAAPAHMPQTRRSLIWGLIGLLFTLAFIRSLAPERTERAVRRLLAVQDGKEKDENEKERRELQSLKEELERERKALERWKEELDQKRVQVEEEENERELQEKEVQKHVDRNGDDPDAYTEVDHAQGTAVEEHQPAAESEESGDDASTSTLASDTSISNTSLDLADAPAESLSDEECPIIVAPESASAGLGTQIEHLWTSLSLTLAIRNACMVVPPVVSSDGFDIFRPVPFHQVFDLAELSRTGLRFVPLRTCQKHGVATVFDDKGAESAIVKNFAAFVKESHPSLAEESTLVHGDSNGYRFLKEEEVKEDVTVVAEYIRGKLPEEAGRHCVGMGRMCAPVAINPDVLEHFIPAKAVADYVQEKFPRANETLFVQLRWNSAHCDKARTEKGTVCVFSDNAVPVDEYVFAVAHAANVVGAKAVYLSAPAHIPDDVSEFLAKHLNTIDPVLLDVDGDFFTANVIERELAVRSARFIPDGGAWGDAVQKSRQSHFPHLFVETVNSLTIIQEWKNAGALKICRS